MVNILRASPDASWNDDNNDEGDDREIDLMETNDSLDTIANNDSNCGVLEICLELSS